MSVMRPSADLLRCYYTGESVQQVQRAIGLLKPGTPPIPTAASVAEGAAAQPVAVDQFLRGPLSSVAGLAQILWGIPFQGTSWCSSR